MKKVFLFIISLSLISALQAQNILKEVKSTFNTYSSKTTMVVLPSSSLADLMLRDAVNSGWRISPFEFCSQEEYEKLKTNSDLFFLMRVDGIFRSELEPKIEYLTLVKGGRELKKGLFSTQNIITLPLQQLGDNSAANLHLLPFYIDFIQSYIYRVQLDASIALKGSASYASNISEIRERELIFPTEYLNFDTDESYIKSLFNDKITIVSADDAEDAIVDGAKNKVVPVIIKPRGEDKGSYCYKLLIGSDNHQLYFFRRHKVSDRSPVGFTKEDLRKISIPFQF